MTRKLLQTILCIVLCPLLAAQQASPAASTSPQPEPAQRFVTLPSGAGIQLLPPGPTGFARERAGVAVQFALDRDVVVEGVTLVHAGVPVAGVVEAVKRGSHFKHRAAEMDIRVTGMAAGKPTELHLRCFDPDAAPPDAYSDDRPHTGFNPVTAALITVGVLCLLALVAGDR